MATFADKPTIEGERIILRPLQSGDADALLAAMENGDSMRLTGTHATFTLEQLEAWVTSRPLQDDRLDLAIIDRVSGAFVGDLAINEWDADNQSCNFRIALTPAGQNRGIGTEATRLIVGYVFEHLPIHRISLDVYAFNPRAAHVYTTVGFVVEGRARHTLLWDGTFHDSVLMSILRPDWEADRAARTLRP